MRRSGKLLWRKERPTDAVRESPDSYTTPMVLTVDGKSQIIVHGGDYVTAPRPGDGRRDLAGRRLQSHQGRQLSHDRLAADRGRDGLCLGAAKAKAAVGDSRRGQGGRDRKPPRLELGRARRAPMCPRRSATVNICM